MEANPASMKTTKKGAQWRTKRPIEDIDDPTIDELLSRMKAIPILSVRAYLSLIWLTGNRASELLGIKARKKVGEYVYKRGTKKNPNRTVIIAKWRNLTKAEIQERGLNEWEVPPPKRWDIEVDSELPVVYLQARTLKRGNRPRHSYIARIDTEEELTMWEMVVEYISIKQPQDTLFRFSRNYAWNKCDKYLGIPVHKLRGLRATRDAVRFHQGAIALKNKFNWSNPSMAFHYAKKDTKDLVKGYMEYD
jgi:integrase